ncbi:MAG: helicase-related protein, partial [Candidatus Poribacteria bacterium]|nr:helicase-related protein [Candidatus Poribacteria bacterium]
KGVLPNQQITVVAVNWRRDAAVDLFYIDSTGNPGAQLLFRSKEPDLEIVTTGLPWSFDGDGDTFRLVSEAHRIRLAHLFDPLLAVHISQVEPLPHQITAVYEDMLPRQPLRYLLADDPGAGKTIMTGLYLKELLVRGDLKRCLIVCPGSLVEQWQAELAQRFHLHFEIFTREKFNTAPGGNLFKEENFLICRLDQLSRYDRYQAKLRETDWDIIVCDEAHKMSAPVFGNKPRFTKRYHLGQLLGKLTRHFLLLTATPHNGKEADFQLFMALLDADRFEGQFREGVHTTDTSDLMRRMVKEDLLKFDGTRLFPERYAYTINYELSESEKSLYDEVTTYVRKEMNRADRIKGQQGNRIGFALTILQRRLASSPEAIYRSIQRRRQRLEERLQEEQHRKTDPQATLDIQVDNRLPTDAEQVDEFYDESPAEEVETTEEKVVARASAARTITELQAEIQTLKHLEGLAQRVRQSRTDRKWEELSNLLQGESDADAAKELFDAQGHRRKLIIFTEHRDTLQYLAARIETLIGRAEELVTIHGSMRREDRRKVQEAFMQDPDVRILVATDAAGEGINLHRAHLMVNYDLPWNPNRIEQRFGRIHRIGQTEVCNLWNLVSAETREGEVFNTLLHKLRQQRDALGGAVFDVLGKCFADTSLRNLLIQAIREGDKPEVKARLTKVIDGVINRDSLQTLINENVLTHGIIDTTRLGNIREEMERAEARRLQPHFIASFFREAFSRLQGKLYKREPGRYEIRHVPGGVRNRSTGIGKPILDRYERITFEKDKVNIQGKPLAEFVCPGHPLLDATLRATLERHRNLLKKGTILIDSDEQSNEVRVLFYLENAIQDGRTHSDGSQHVISRQMQFVEINSNKTVRSPGYAPYLDYRPIDENERSLIKPLLGADWLNTDLESEIKDYAVAHLISEHFDEVKARRETLVQKTIRAVQERLTKEIHYWDNQAYELEQEAKTPKKYMETLKSLVEVKKILKEHGVDGPEVEDLNDNEQELREWTAKANAINQNATRAGQRADELQARREKRMEELEQERHISPMPPVVIGGALIVPQSLLDTVSNSESATPVTFSQTDRERIDRLAVAAVMEAERKLGREPREMPHQNPGYDIESRDPKTNQLLFIEVKGKSPDAPTVTVSKTQIFTAFNKPDSFILAIVEVDGDTAKGPRYIRQPFKKEPDFGATSVNYNLSELLARAEPPS